MNTVKMLVTPAQAKEWLDSTNKRNRPLTMARARTYASDMKSGHWYETHQGIAFYEDGILADGQTRLKAITIADVPVEMNVSFGLPIEASLGIDAHRMRATADQIAISQSSPWIGKNEIAIAKAMLRLEGDTSERRSTTEIADFCEKHKERILFGNEAVPMSQRYISVAPVRCALSLAYGHEEKDRLMQFGSVLQSGVMSSMDDVAAIRLRERLLISGHAFHANSTARRDCILITQRAIKAFCDREQIKRVYQPTTPIYKL